MWATLGELVHPSKAKADPQDIQRARYIGLEHIEKDTGKLLGFGYSDEVRSTKSVFHRGDLLYGKLRPYLNKVHLADSDGVCSTDILVFPRSAYVLNKYLLYRFLSSDFVRYASLNVSGVQHPRTNFKTLSQFPLALPPALEQRRIVEVIETQFTRLDAAVAALERARANVERYKASVLKAACEGRLVPTEAELYRRGEVSSPSEPADALLERILAERRKRWEEEHWQHEIERAQKKAAQARRKAAGQPYAIRDLEPEDWQDIPEEEYASYLPKDDRWKRKYKEPEPPDMEGLPELPEGWSIASMDQLTTMITSGPRHWSEYYDKGNGVFLMAQNIRLGKLDLSYHRLVGPPEDDSSRDRSQVIKGDLLVTIVGANTGDVCRVPHELPNHYVCQSVALMRPVEAPLSDYLTLYMTSPENGQRQYRRYIYGAGRPHLKFDELRMTAVMIPTLAEQRRIVEEVERRLSVVAALEAAVEANLRRAGRLRQSILKRAFEGRLVSQDPDDEPASALLERIQARR